MPLGAPPRIILRQFLAEAVILCIFGGVGGAASGRACSILVRAAFHWPTHASPAAVGVTARVGLVFGYHPAGRASRLDPIEALRYE